MPAQYPNNLNELLGGGMASINATLQQQANAEQQDALDQQRQTLANQYSEQTNPIKAQQEQATLEQTLAQNPGVAATSRKLGVEANIAEATQDSDIKAKLSKNLSAMSDDQIKRLGNMGQSMIHMADLVDAGQQMPLEMQQSLPPEIVQALASPEGRAKLRQRGQQMALDTSEHLRAKEIEKMKNDTQRYVSDNSYKAAVYAADQRLAVAKLKRKEATDAFSSAKTLEAQVAAANANEVKARAEGDDDEADHWKSIATAMYTNAVNLKAAPGTTGKLNIEETNKTKVPVTNKAAPYTSSGNANAPNTVTTKSGRQFTPN